MQDQQKKLVLVDADGLVYHSSKNTLEESINILDEKIQNIFIKTEATHYVFFISKDKYFRHNIDPLYKSNRSKYPTQLKWIKTLKSYLIENWNAQWMDLMESDDLIAYWINNDLKENILDDDITYFDKILVSPDKDLLQSIPGKNFNYTYKLKDDIKALVKEDVMYQIQEEDVIKGWWIETSIEDSLKWQSFQLISGDAGDNVITPFPENCGIFNNKLDSHEILHGYIWGMYYETPSGQKKTIDGLGRSKGVYEFQKNYRLLHLLDCNDDFMREIGRLPEFPIITEIQKLNEEIKIDF